MGRGAEEEGVTGGGGVVVEQMHHTELGRERERNLIRRCFGWVAKGNIQASPWSARATLDWSRKFNGGI
jgi:hypothetical protein